MERAWTALLLLQGSYRSVEAQWLLILVLLLCSYCRVSRATGTEGIITGLNVVVGWGMIDRRLASIGLLALEGHSRLWLRLGLRLGIDVVRRGEAVGVAVIWVEVRTKLSLKLRSESPVRRLEAGGLKIAGIKGDLVQSWVCDCIHRFDNRGSRADVVVWRVVLLLEGSNGGGGDG